MSTSFALWQGSADGLEQALFAIPALTDNYIYVLTRSNHALIIDPGEAQTVERFVTEKQLAPVAILNTHHHQDHTSGNCALKKFFNCPIIGPDDERIPCLEQRVDHDELTIGPWEICVIKAPGHTATHVVYYFPQDKMLFSGDALFGAGCGRLFEGSVDDLYTSLDKMRRLPDETLIFCGHEYTEKNLRFALSLEPNNAEVAMRLKEVERLRVEQKPTTGFTLALEKLTNPFLRFDLASFKKSLGMEKASDIEVLKQLRSRRDNF